MRISRRALRGSSVWGQSEDEHEVKVGFCSEQSIRRMEEKTDSLTSRKSAGFLVVFYVVALVFVDALTGFSLRLSYLIPLLFPLALIERDSKRFLLDWTPFYLVILAYDLFRGSADDLGQRVDFTTLPAVEKWLFGGILPTVWIQDNLLMVLLSWLGIVMEAFYFGHFILPVVTLYWMWRHNAQDFRWAMGSIVLLSMAGFLTFALFPAAPPWMASYHGVIPKIHKLVSFHIESLLPGNHWLEIYVQMNPNQVAPFPSLHAGYPLLLWLWSRRCFPRAQWFFLINVLVVCLTIVAFGEHYVVDLLAGWLYAWVSLIIMDQLVNRLGAQEPDHLSA